MAKQIIITVSPDGSTSVEAKGFKGKGCKEATDQIERALGKTDNVKRKPEWFAARAAARQVQGG